MVGSKSGTNAHLPNGNANVFHKWQWQPGTNWSGREAIPRYLTRVSAVADTAGRLELFGANTHIPDGNTNVFHKWQWQPGTNWSGWEAIPGYLTSVSAVANTDGRLELF